MRLLSNLQAGDAAVEAFELIPRFSAALVGEHFPICAARSLRRRALFAGRFFGRG